MSINPNAPVVDPTQNLGQLQSGEQVFERLNSHMISHPVPSALLSEAFASISADGRPFIVQQVDFDHVVGASTCVCTQADDTVVYGQRRAGEGLTPFVHGRQLEPTRSVVVILKRFDDAERPEGFYVLVTAFIGKKAEPLPWNTPTLEKAEDPVAAYQQSVDFWDSHALLWGSEKVMEETVTNQRPW